MLLTYNNISIILTNQKKDKERKNLYLFKV